jgi:hypothetical protein
MALVNLSTGIIWTGIAVFVCSLAVLSHALVFGSMLSVFRVEHSVPNDYLDRVLFFVISGSATMAIGVALGHIALVIRRTLDRRGCEPS